MSKKITTEEFIERAKKIYNDKYDYSKTKYISYHDKVNIFCKKHQEEFSITPADFLSGHGCKKCGYETNTSKRTSNTKEFINKAKKIHNNKYNYSLVNYANSQTKIKIICPEHGEFEQTPNSHLKGRGCPVCGLNENKSKRAKSAENFIKDSLKIHGNKYNYNLVNYINNKVKVKIICPIHGVFEQSPNIHLKGCGCPQCFYKSRGEEIIALVLEENGFKQNIDFFREYKFEDCKDKNSLPFDFYIPSKNLLIEFNGKQHYEKRKGFKDTRESFLLRKHHDWLKRKYAHDNNINLLIIPYWKFGSLISRDLDIIKS